MRKVNIHEAKTHLLELIESVLLGEEIVIVLEDKPVAKLEDIKKCQRRFGLLKNKIKISKDFDAPL